MPVMKLVDTFLGLHEFPVDTLELSPRPDYQDFDAQNRLLKYAIDGALHIIRPYKTKSYRIPINNVSSADATLISGWWEDMQELEFYPDLVNTPDTYYEVKIFNTQAPLYPMYPFPDLFEGTLEIRETSYSETPDVETKTFTECCQAKTALPKVIFTYNSLDYSTYVIDVSAIRRDSYLSAGNVDVTLDNGNGIFDDFLDDHIELYQKAIIAFGFAGLEETKNLFTGYVESVEIGLKSVVLRIKDRLSLLLEKVVGSGENPVIFPTNNPDDMVWELLTTYGGLDDTESEANTDIDWTSFTAWTLDMSEFGNQYFIKGYAGGETIGYLLRKIMELTNSIFWQNGEGKIAFASMNEYTLGTVPITKEYVLGRNYNCDLHGMINNITCQYGLDLDTDIWAGFVSGQRIYGPATFTTSLYEEDRAVWHVDAESANRFRDETFDRLAGPIREFEITTAMIGFLSDVGNVENLFNHYAEPNNSIDIRIKEIAYDVMNWEVVMRGQWLWDMEP